MLLLYIVEILFTQKLKKKQSYLFISKDDTIHYNTGKVFAQLTTYKYQTNFKTVFLEYTFYLHGKKCPFCKIHLQLKTK